MTQKGIVVAQDGASLTSADTQYDSRKKRLMINLRPDLKHVALLEMVGGTALQTNAGNGYHNEEILFGPFPHKLGFTPRCLVYFYVESINGDPNAVGAGGYGDSVYFYSGSSGTIEDKIFFVVDDTNFYIKHTIDDFFGIGWTSTANTFFMGIKYMICSNKLKAI